MKSNYNIDKRSLTDIYNEISELAESYTPEWRFETENPDIGSAIAMVFASQLYDNVKKTNQVLDKYRVEFVNLLDLSILPAVPSEGVVVMKMISGTVPGTHVMNGTKLLGESPEDAATPITFETTQTMYVTSASIDSVIGMSREKGKIISYKGQLKEAELLRTSDDYIINDEEDNKDENKGFSEFELFNYTEKGVAKNVLVLYHNTAFDIVPNGTILIRFQNLNHEDYESFVNPDLYKWKYYADGEFVQVEKIELDNDCFRIHTSKEFDKISIGGEEYQSIIIESCRPIKEDIYLDDIVLASEAEEQQPDFIYFDNTDLDKERFMPFGDTARLFSECYIGSDKMFIQRGAEISLEFNLSYEEKLLTMTPEQEDAELKIIKKKSKKIQYDVASTCIEKVIFEYFNSRGWTKLECHEDIEGLFSGKNEGEIKISFTCPEDLQIFTEGGYEGPLIRVRVLQADNCYLQPCKHIMPVISNLKISYRYEKDWRHPSLIDSVVGTYKNDITRSIIEDKKVAIFKPMENERDCLLIGLSRKPEGEPFSLLFILEDNANYEKQHISFEYSSNQGFKRLKIIDLTGGLRKTGLVMVMTPADFAPLEIENVKKYWIRIVNENSKNQAYPTIKNIYLNGINITNKETKPEIDFYIDNTEANLSLKLPYTNILGSEVYVNEKNTLSISEIEDLKEEGYETLSDYDYLGNLKSLFVKWKEVSNFDYSKAGDRHYVLDRMTNRINFGDGINVRIPQSNRDVAVKAIVMCCDGEKANLPAGTITSPQGRLMYIGEITNPIETFGGSDIERTASALDRGANILSSKKRLVSYLDFEREAKLSFSQIHATKCVTNTKKSECTSDNQVKMIVLTKEFEKGSCAFESLAEKLREKLLVNNEYVLDKISIVEPTFVKIEANIWISTSEYEKVFEIQNKFINELNEFIDPIVGCYGNGWDIGRLPTSHQLRMIMKKAESGAVVKHYTITASYRDEEGFHEVDYNDLKITPYMVGINGKHKVVIESFK